MTSRPPEQCAFARPCCNNMRFKTNPKPPPQDPLGGYEYHCGGGVTSFFNENGHQIIQRYGAWCEHCEGELVPVSLIAELTSSSAPSLRVKSRLDTELVQIDFYRTGKRVVWPPEKGRCLNAPGIFKGIVLFRIVLHLAALPRMR